MEPQLIPEGLLVTVPLPVPFIFTVSVGFCEKVAVTDLLASTTTWHDVLVPLQAPLQVGVDQPLSGVAVSVTVVLAAKEAEHVPRQLLIPDGLLLTEPFPDTVTVSVNVELVEKLAVTVLLASIVTVHWLPEVESQPLQLVKVEPDAAVAVSVTTVPRI